MTELAAMRMRKQEMTVGCSDVIDRYLPDDISQCRDSVRDRASPRCGVYFYMTAQGLRQVNHLSSLLARIVRHNFNLDLRRHFY